MALGNGGDRAVHVDAREGFLPILYRLLAYGADVNIQNLLQEAPLHQALQRGQTPTSLTLLSNGASWTITHDKGSTALHLSAKKSAHLVLEIVAKAAKSVNLPLVGDCEGATPLHMAVRINHQETVDVLIRLGANVDAVQTSKDGAVPTALWQAGWNKNLDIAAKLLEAGADPNSRGKDKATVLHLAVAKRWPEMVRLLARHKAGLNAQTADKRRPLHAAVLMKDLSMVRLLLELGARDLHKRASGDFTALHHAARKGQLACAKWLLELGIDKSVRSTTARWPFNVKGTAAEVARAVDVAEFIEKYEAEAAY
ncbi:ankyrin [Colletotrichum caudatum]|nr:ankyrin [Colletotrichum caudatum]